MSWLVGIIAVIVVIMFWRIFLPLGIFAVIVIGAIALFIHYNDEKSASKLEAEHKALKQKISTARENASPEGKRWEVFYKKDPASGIEMGRAVRIRSNDALCSLSVERLLDGSELTDIDCPDFKISEWEDIEVKFDNEATSNKMDIKSYSDSDGIYIPSYQDSYSDDLSYAKFIEQLKTGKAVAIKMPAADGIWMAFSLLGFSEAFNKLGKQREPISEQTIANEASKGNIISNECPEKNVRELSNEELCGCLGLSFDKELSKCR